MTLAGTIMASRIPKNVAFSNDNQMKGSGRGSHDGPLHFASSSSGIEHSGSCIRWSKTENEYITIKKPAIVADYNAKIGGVDLLDRVIGKYAIRGRTKKWTIRAIYHFFDSAVAACWLEYRPNASSEGLRIKDTLDHLDFKLSVAQYLILTKKRSEQSEGNSEQSECEEEETPPLKQRKVQPVPDRRVRTVDEMLKPRKSKRCEAKYVVMGMIVSPDNIELVLRAVEMRFGRADLRIAKIYLHSLAKQSFSKESFGVLVSRVMFGVSGERAKEIMEEIAERVGGSKLDFYRNLTMIFHHERI
ncbi:hypothetical protein JTB14_011963 [Gonioctena quinquepunctata]|nr:hypothetical protein JTB14_011963 [Gonioctena quinquepunctata]